MLKERRGFRGYEIYIPKIINIKVLHFEMFTIVVLRFNSTSRNRVCKSLYLYYIKVKATDYSC